MPLDIAQLEKLEEEAQSRLDPASDNYEEMAASLSRISSLVDAHYKREVDDTGKLTKEPATRQPARVGEGESDYFFEPNTREVREFFKRDPGALDRLRDKRGNPIRAWAEGMSQPEIRSPMYDGQTQALTGYNVTPGKTYLDTLSEEQEPYGLAADEMWRLASENATKSGKALKRYRDIKLDTNEWKDYIEGGVKKGLSRVVAPATLGAADSMSANLASPAYDALLKSGRARQASMTPEEKDSAREWGYDPEDTQDMGSSEEIQNRSMPAYVVGNIAGYSMPGNPANAAQKIIQEGLKYSTRGVAGRAGVAALAGGGANAAESVIGDTGRRVMEGEPINVGDVGWNALRSAGVGTVAGGGFDLAGQGVGGVREGYRRFERNAPLRTLEEAGGRADVVTGVAAPVEIREAYDEMHKPKPDGPPTHAGSELAGDLAPHLEQSAKKRARDEQAKIAAQEQEYYNHPAYRDVKVTAAPAVQGLIDMATRGLTRGPLDGSIMPMNPESVDEVGRILRTVSQPSPPTARADAPALANTTGGVVVDGELANRLYRFQPDDPNYYRPGTDAVIRPVEINAEQLTTLEGRIDNVLKYAKTPGGADEPVWQEFNKRVKKMRDDFELYRDADGKLVAPPEAQPEPFARAEDLPPEDGLSTLPRPSPIGSPPRPQSEALPGVGPGQPALPDTFDPRAAKRQDLPADELPRPVGVGGEGMVARPEGLYGVGPGGPPIPENPFDPRLPTSREAINPRPTVAVQGDVSEPGYIGPEAIPGAGPNYQPPDDPRRFGPPVAVQGQFDMGGEYARPQSVDPSARQGIGPRRDAPQYESLKPQPTQSVEGTYNQPPEVQMERAPTTERNPYGFAARGEPPHETPLPPSERNPLAPSKVSEESLATMAGNRSDELVKDGEFNEKYYQQEYGPTSPAPAKEEPRVPTERSAPVVEQPATAQAPAGKSFGIVDESTGLVREKTFATKEEARAEAKRLGTKLKSQRFKVREVDGQSVSPLEKSLDAQLGAADAPPVPVKEIEEAGARQTADREQVAQNQKEYGEEIFSPGREARAREVEKVKNLTEHKEVIDEALRIVNDIDRRLGGEKGIPAEQKLQMLLGMLKEKLGRDIDPEDLIRYGLISAGLVQLSTSDDDASNAVGAGILGLGLGGKGKKGSEPEAPKGPSKAKPTQPEAKLEDGTVVRGFSAMRNEQHNELDAIEKAMKRLGVEGDSTLESRIRTYGQHTDKDRKKIDEALFGEAKNIDKASEAEAKKNRDKGEPPTEVTDRVGELRRAAGANAYPGLRDRSWPGGSSRSLENAIIDMLGTRFLYRGSEYLSGRFNREFERNPFIRGNDTTSSKMQQELLQEPARRLLNLTGGGPASRLGGEQLWELLKGDSVYESKEEYEKKQKQKLNKDKHP